MECLQMRGLCRFLLPARRPPNLLIPHIHQHADLRPDQHARVQHHRLAVGALFQQGGATSAAHARSAGLGTHLKSSLPQHPDPFLERVNLSLLATKKHTPSSYNAWVPYILALDEGTTSARAVLYDSEGRRLAMESTPFPCEYPQPGWVEQDAELIWSAQLTAARRVLDRAGIPASELAAMGITNH